MDENELERRLSELAETWRVPRDPPLERIWQAVEARAFPARRQERGRRIRTLLPLAAILLLGIGIGRLAPRLGGPNGSQATRGSDALPAVRGVPFVGVASDYLERVTALLVTLADANRRGQSLDPATLQARDLLATTRLLLAAPQAADPRLQALLSDLELVLAQIVRLPEQTPGGGPDGYLIDQALDQREVLPRLRELLAENSTSQP